MPIRNLNWQLEANFSRAEVIAMSKVAGYVANIEKALTEGFPSSSKEINWSHFKSAMRTFEMLGEQDTLAYKVLCGDVNAVNNNELMLMAGKVIKKDNEKVDMRKP